MACSLVPPLNCSCFHQTPQAKSRGSVSFYVQCVSSRMTAVIDFERMQIPTLDVHSSYFTATGSLGYEGDTGPPAKTDLEAIMPKEALLTSEEATIAAAAAEAIALARAAVEVAKEAAQMKGNEPSSILNNLENFQAEKFRLSETTSETQNQEGKVTSNPSSDEGISLLLHNELSLQEIQESKKVTVRSRRQTERRAKRAKAATKAANGVVSVKSGSFSKKKRAAVQEVDYSDPLYYLRRMTNTSKLLTASEELELSEGIQDLVKLEKLQEELRNGSPSLPTFAQWASAVGVDERTLRKRLAKGKHCKDKMIKSNIRLVISIAKNFQGAGMNLQDLVQEGCRGLVKGAEKFDASKGFKFSTYAHWWIKQAVRRSLSEQSRTIRLPFHMVEATYRVREARKQLYSEHGRYPDNEEVAKAAGLTMKRLNAVMLTPKAPRSLDQKIGIDMNLKPSEIIADPDALTSEEILVKQIVRRDLNKVLDSLSPREKQVIGCRFGLGDGRMKTLQEIGELIGVSRERIRQIESCAFRKLKNRKRNKSLRQHLIP